MIMLMLTRLLLMAITTMSMVVCDDVGLDGDATVRVTAVMVVIGLVVAVTAGRQPAGKVNMDKPLTPSRGR